MIGSNCLMTIYLPEERTIIRTFSPLSRVLWKG